MSKTLIPSHFSSMLVCSLAGPLSEITYTISSIPGLAEYEYVCQLKKIIIHINNQIHSYQCFFFLFLCFLCSGSESESLLDDDDDDDDEEDDEDEASESEDEDPLSESLDEEESESLSLDELLLSSSSDLQNGKKNEIQFLAITVLIKIMISSTLL